jgi:tetratricopeptide (TPR) repeat protein
MMRHARTTGCLLVCGLLFAGWGERWRAAAAEDAVAAGLQAAEESFRRNDGQAAAAILEKLAPQAVGQPREADVQRRLGDCYVRLGRIVDALTAYRKAEERYDAPPPNPRGSWDMAVAIGDLLIRSGDRKQTLRHYEGELRRTDREQRAELYRRIMQVQQELGDFDGGLKTIETAGAEFSDTDAFGNRRPYGSFKDELVFRKAELLRVAKRGDEAKKIFLELPGKAAPAEKWGVTWDVARKLRDMGQQTDAIRLYESLYPLASDAGAKESLFREISWSFNEMERLGDAWPALRKLAGGSPDDRYLAAGQLAYAYERRWMFVPMAVICKEVADLGGLSPVRRIDALLNASHWAWRGGDYANGSDGLTTANVEMPEKVKDPGEADRLRRRMAGIYREREHVQYAMALYRKSAEIRGGWEKADYELLYNYGLCLEARGQLNDAADYLARVAQATGDRGDRINAWNAYRRCRWQAGDLVPLSRARRDDLPGAYQPYDRGWHEQVVRDAGWAYGYGLEGRALEQMIRRLNEEMKQAEIALKSAEDAAQALTEEKNAQQDTAAIEARKAKLDGLNRLAGENRNTIAECQKRNAELQSQYDSLKPKLGRFRIEIPVPVVYAGDPAGLDLWCVNATTGDLQAVKLDVTLGKSRQTIEVGSLPSLVTAKVPVQPAAEGLGKARKASLTVRTEALGEEKATIRVLAMPSPVPLDFANGQIVIEAETGSCFNTVKETEEDGKRTILALDKGAGSGAVDYFLKVSAPCRVTTIMGCAGPAWDQPPEAITLQMDDGGPQTWFTWDGRRLNRIFPEYELTPGVHRLRVVVWNPTVRLDQVLIRPSFRYRLAAFINPEGYAGTFFSDEKAKFNAQLHNLADRPVSLPGAVEVLDMYGKVMTSESVAADIPADGRWERTFEMRPASQGMMQLKAKLKADMGLFESGLEFASIFRPAEGFRFDSPFLQKTGDLGLAARVGVKWVHFELNWREMEPAKGVYAWGAMDGRANAARADKLYLAVLLSHAPDWAIAWGGRVPGHRRGDDSPSPDHFDDYTEFCYQFAKRYGDVVKLYEVWNEPWEGGGISGWGASGQHMRNLTRALWKGVKRAEKELYPNPTRPEDCLLVGGLDSDANNLDNVFTDPDFLRDCIDVITVHTTTTPFFTHKLFLHHEARRLGKRMWDTESWSGNFPVSIIMNLSRGLEKSQPISPGQFGDRVTWVQHSALAHFIEDTKFYKEVNPQCLPYVFLFKSPDGAKKTAVVFGQLGPWGSYVGQMWDEIRVNGEMIVDDPKNEFEAFNGYGNALAKRNGQCVIPLNQEEHFFVTTRGDIGGLDEALAKAKVTGITPPVQISLDDFTRPPEDKPDMVVRVVNAVNEPLNGTVSVELQGGIKLAETAKEFKGLESGQTLELRFKTAGGSIGKANVFPVRVTVRSERGEAVHTENLAVSCIVQGTPVIDGDVGEWSRLGAIPVALYPKRVGVDYWAGAKYEWIEVPKFSRDDKDSYAEAAAMWDPTHFYFMMKVRTDAGFQRGSMLKDPWYEMMPKPGEYVYKWGPQIPGGISRLRIAFDSIPNTGADLLGYDPASPTFKRFAYPATDYEYSLYEITGGTEVWRHKAPGVRWDDYYPFSPLPTNGLCQQVIPDAKLAFKHDEKNGVWYVECAMPLSELSELKPEPGRQTGFNFMITDIGHWSEGRSACKLNVLAFHPYWGGAYSHETQWGFTGPRKQLR